MKKTNKIILGFVVILMLVVGIQKGLKYFLQGPARPFNALIVSGEKENVDKAKEIYKDNTKYKKDYKYKIVTNIQTVLDENEKKIDYEFKYLVITKDTAKEMLKDKVLRVLKNPGSGSIETVVLESIPNIDSEKTLYFNNENEDSKLEINGKDIPLEYGSYSWIGYYPSEQGSLIVTDNETYNSIDEKDKYMTLIRFAKGKKDLRNSKDKEEINKQLINTQILEINYANVD